MKLLKRSQSAGPADQPGENQAFRHAGADLQIPIGGTSLAWRISPLLVVAMALVCPAQSADAPPKEEETIATLPEGFLDAPHFSGWGSKGLVFVATSRDKKRACLFADGKLEVSDGVLNGGAWEDVHYTKVSGGRMVFLRGTFADVFKIPYERLDYIELRDGKPVSYLGQSAKARTLVSGTSTTSLGETAVLESPTYSQDGSARTFRVKKPEGLDLLVGTHVRTGDLKGLAQWVQSMDGKKLIYLTKGEKPSAQELHLPEKVVRGMLFGEFGFARDGTPFYAAAKLKPEGTPGDWNLYVGSEKSPPCGSLANPVVLGRVPGDWIYSFKAASGGPWQISSGGKTLPVAGYNGIASRSPDGSHLAIELRDSPKGARVWLDATLGELSYDAIDEFHWSPDSTALACLATRKGLRFVIQDGKESGPWERIKVLGFSAAPPRFRYIGSTKQRAAIFEGGEAVAEGKLVQDAVLTADGKVMASLSREDGCFVVFDRKETILSRAASLRSTGGAAFVEVQVHWQRVITPDGPSEKVKEVEGWAWSEDGRTFVWRARSLDEASPNWMVYLGLKKVWEGDLPGGRGCATRLDNNDRVVECVCFRSPRWEFHQPMPTTGGKVWIRRIPLR